MTAEFYVLLGTAASIGFIHTVTGPDHYLPFIVLAKARHGIRGMKKAMQKKAHLHEHGHENGILHQHTHTHLSGHTHVHTGKDNKSLTPWILFLIFVFRPCKPLIPLLMVPASKNSLSGLIMVTVVLAGVTIATMMLMVSLALSGIQFIHLKKAERFAHAIAGFTTLLCGLGILFLGL